MKDFILAESGWPFTYISVRKKIYTHLLCGVHHVWQDTAVSGVQCTEQTTGSEKSLGTRSSERAANLGIHSTGAAKRITRAVQFPRSSTSAVIPWSIRKANMRMLRTKCCVQVFRLCGGTSLSQPPLPPTQRRKPIRHNPTVHGRPAALPPLHSQTPFRRTLTP